MTDTTYEAIVEAVRQHCRRDPNPGAAAQAMTRAVAVLLQTRSRAEIEALAADRSAWNEAVRLHVRAGPAGGNDVDLAREILPQLFEAAVALDTDSQAPAPRPTRGKHFAARLAERMAA
ncbi:hypothetical protein G6L68_25045 [Agrobacterium fabrum]|uniref:hypothetical protein n=1 Tax=Agrobacterium fabrum TaxID=1176649 RepID=UPI000EF5FF15|nr:hypothetical protein [Agrobacterium fabrum]AYM66153.1 hypothetical protein At12D13_50010 [Agrobacterium fabrum]NTE63900.1 hypothetical protein [Agrobacterium fabrum]